MKKVVSYSLIGIGLLIALFPPLVRGQELTCEERYFDKTLSNEQNFLYIDVFDDSKEFDEEFTKEYFLVNLSSPGCEDCIVQAQEINENDLFQEYFGMSGSCDFGTYVDNTLLDSRINDIGSGSFIAKHSFDLTGMTTYYLPQLFSSPVATQLPTFLLVNRVGEVEWRYEGALPEERIYEYCLRDDVCLDDMNDDEIDDDTDDEDSEEDDNDNTDSGNDGPDSGPGDGTNGSTPPGSGPGGGTNGSTPPGSGPGDGTNGSTPPGSSNGGTGEPGSGPPSGGEGGSGPGEGGDGGGNGDGPALGIEPTPIPPSQIEQDPGRLQIEIPWESQRDVVTNESILTTSNSKDSLRITRRQVNRRLRILFGVSLLVAIVYAGFKFITSLGDSEKAKAGLKTFLYIGVAFAIALFSFIIVRLVTNLFIS